jgi:hypothetical protein
VNERARRVNGGPGGMRRTRVAHLGAARPVRIRLARSARRAVRARRGAVRRAASGGGAAALARRAAAPGTRLAPGGRPEVHA